MQFIEGKNRSQSILFPQSLDQLISPDNEVRIIDLFVESIKLAGFHFTMKVKGRPASLSSKRPVEDLCVWLSQSHQVEPSTGKRMQTQHRANVAHEAINAGS